MPCEILSFKNAIKFSFFTFCFLKKKQNRNHSLPDSKPRSPRVNKTSDNSNLHFSFLE